MLHKDHVRSVTRDENNEYAEETKSQVCLNVIEVITIILNEIVTWYRVYHWWGRILLFYHVNQTRRPWHLNVKKRSYGYIY